MKIRTALGASRLTGGSRRLCWRTTGTGTGTTTYGHRHYRHAYHRGSCRASHFYNQILTAIGARGRRLIVRCGEGRRTGMADFKGWDPSRGIRFATSASLHTSTLTMQGTRRSLDLGDYGPAAVPPLSPLPPLDGLGRVIGAPGVEKKTRTKRVAKAAANAATEMAVETVIETETAAETSTTATETTKKTKVTRARTTVKRQSQSVAAKQLDSTVTKFLDGELTYSNLISVNASAEGVEDINNTADTAVEVEKTVRKRTARRAATKDRNGEAAAADLVPDLEDGKEKAPRSQSLKDAVATTTLESVLATSSADVATGHRRRVTKTAAVDVVLDTEIQPGLPRREAKLPQTLLPVTIVEERWNAARAAAPGSPESYFSYRLYEGPAQAPSLQPTPVEVHYCKTVDEMEDVCVKHFANEKVVGVDLEWMVYVRKSLQGDPRQYVSLIQMSSPTRVALFHVAMFRPQVPDGSDGGTTNAIPTPDDLVAPTFRAMMEDPSILKLGVCILGDTNRLKKYLGIDTVGSFELSHLWKVVRYRPYPHLHAKANRSPVRLALQVHDILGLPMNKERDLRGSSWTQPLSPSQIEYSATDAFSYIQLFHMLEEERLTMDPPLPRPWVAESKKPLNLGLAQNTGKADGSGAESPTSDVEVCEATAEDIAPETEDVNIEAETTAVDADVNTAAVDSDKADSESVPWEPDWQGTIRVAGQEPTDEADEADDVDDVDDAFESAEEEYPDSSPESWHDAASTGFSNPDSYYPYPDVDAYESHHESSGLYQDAYPPEVDVYGVEHGVLPEPLEGYDYVPADSPLSPPMASEDDIAPAPVPEPEVVVPMFVPEPELVTTLGLEPDSEIEPVAEPEPEPETAASSVTSELEEEELETAPLSVPQPEPKAAPSSAAPESVSVSGSVQELAPEPVPDQVELRKRKPRTRKPKELLVSEAELELKPRPVAGLEQVTVTEPATESSAEPLAEPSAEPPTEAKEAKEDEEDDPSSPSVRFPPFKMDKDPRVVLAEKLVKEYMNTYSNTVFSAPPTASNRGNSNSITSSSSSSSLVSPDSDSDAASPKRAGVVALRAYFLWRANRDLSPACIGELLRDPPLAPRTVGSYIARAVRREGLPYEWRRFHAEIMPMIPKQLWSKARPHH